MRGSPLLFACTLLGAAPALALSPPAGCGVALEVQYSSCLMSVTWRCDADPEGVRWTALVGEDGLHRVRRLDDEFQWLETIYYPDGRRVQLAPNPVDPASLTELLDTGYDSYDFTLSYDDGSTLRYSGFDRLTGEETVIDGVTLLRTEFEYQAHDARGTLRGSGSGQQYVSAAHRLFLFGEMVDASGTRRLDDPVRLIAPGESGFGASEPIYGCGGLTS